MGGQDSGRVGTFIALVNALTVLNETKHLPSESELSVFSIVRRLREQRFEMVNSHDQYVFIHDMLRRYQSRDQFDSLAYDGWKFGLQAKFGLSDDTFKSDSTFP